MEERRAIRWDKVKNKRLKQTRGVSFEEILKARFMKFQAHPQLSHQTYMLFERRGYVWVVPFVVDEKGIFLKSLFPHRKFTRLYKRGEL